ncbi:MAG: hypothetical protein IH606_19130 [Burkholderiales bacterium]|nr:hypothetical protein [Burkholderiales bacterium]
MYLRVSTTQADPSKTDAAVKELNDSVRNELKKVQGLAACYSAWNEDGSGVTVAIYESREQAEGAADHVRAIWSTMGSMLTAPPSIKEYENVIDLKA